MAKKKRKTKISRYIAIEGEREKVFYDFLYDLYKPENNNIHIKLSKINGGNQVSILNKAIKEINNRNMCYVWLDDDFKIKNNDKNKEFIDSLNSLWGTKIDYTTQYKDLQKIYNKDLKKPILIISNPCSIEGILIKIFNKNIPENPTTDNLKKAFDSILENLSEKEYYEKHLTKDLLEEKRKSIYELDLLLKIFERN